MICVRGGLRMLVPCAKYCMLSNAHGVHRGSSCPQSWIKKRMCWSSKPQCSRRPKHLLRAVSFVWERPNFSLENRPMKVGAFYEATAELKGFHWRNSFAHGTSIRNPPWICVGDHHWRHLWPAKETNTSTLNQ